jgi:hypothetical protein
MCAFGTGKNYTRLLDRKQVFELHCKLGSIGKVALALYDMGIYNQKTGKKFTDMGLWEASWRYALDNLVEAREVANGNTKAVGDILSDATWYKLVVGKAQQLFTKKQYDAFLDKHSYMKPYV